MEHKGRATLVIHCSIFGRRDREIRWFKTMNSSLRGVCVYLSFTEPRKRRIGVIEIEPDNIRYVTVEIDGKILYDSRTEVPCDMDKWSESRQEWIKK